MKRFFLAGNGRRKLGPPGLAFAFVFAFAIPLAAAAPGSGIVAAQTAVDLAAVDLASPASPFEKRTLAKGVGDDILPVDEAFNFGSIPGDGSWRVFWQVLPGYYLYRDKIRVTRGGEALEVSLPGGEMRDDEVFGRVEVLEGYVELTLPGGRASLEVSYQGCAERGYCYPPQKKLLNSSKLPTNTKNL